MKIILGVLSFINPIFSTFVTFFFYLKNRKLYKFNLVISLSLLAFIYERLNMSGDLSKYILSYENYFSKVHVSDLIKDSESVIYYSWTFFNYILNKLNFNFNYVTLISFIFYFYSILSIIDLIELKYEKNLYRKIIFKFFLCTPLITLFSSYKNSVAFALISYGIYRKIILKEKAIIFIILGCGYHISGIILVLLYYISKKVNIKLNIKKCIVVLFISILTNIILKKIIVSIKLTSLFYKKINTYILSLIGENIAPLLSNLLIYPFDIKT